MKISAALALLVAGCVPNAALYEPADLALGERAYQKCYACHALDGPDPATQGPSLDGIVGRPVAAEAGFAYSPALRAYAARQELWTPAALDAFLADPQRAVPDNEMGFFGIASAEERRALIAYLTRT